MTEQVGKKWFWFVRLSADVANRFRTILASHYDALWAQFRYFHVLLLGALGQDRKPGAPRKTKAQ